MLDHYDVRSGYFNLGIRPPAARRASLGIWRTVKAVLNAAADLDAQVYGARLHARMTCGLRPSVTVGDYCYVAGRP